MKVFEVGFSVEKYQSISCDQSDVGKLSFNASHIDEWISPECYIYNPQKEAGDFYYALGESLMFVSKVYDEMSDIFLRAGQVLPLKVEGLYDIRLINILEQTTALEMDNVGRAKDYKGNDLHINKFAFNADEFTDSSLFKIPALNNFAVFTYTGRLDADKEFIGRYNRLGLTGLEFEEIWSDD